MKKGVYENAHLSATVPRMRDTASSLVVYGFHIAHRLQDKGNILRYNLSSKSKYNKKKWQTNHSCYVDENIWRRGTVVLGRGPGFEYGISQNDEDIFLRKL